MFSLYHLLSIVFVLVQLQLNGWLSSAQSHDSLIDILSNMVDFSIGSLQFLNQNQRYIDEVRNIIPQRNAVYDFVVVGAGTAGITVAARLSEIPNVKVLLIEAGSHENLFMNIPLITSFLQLDNNVTWKYRSKPSDRYCLGMNDNRCNLPRGRVLGGSSVLNYMIASRGIAEDYDRWAEMGNEGWAYKDVLKYFKKLETIDIPGLRNSIYHGTQGPVHISGTFHTPLSRALIKAAQELGYPLIDYNNGKNKIGFSYVQATVMNGSRMSSNRAHLHSTQNRNNLHVTLQSMVRKVLIDRDTNRAIGVEFAKYDKIIRVFARKEVVLCAGAIGSPQLLMLSGIGPSDRLAELGIDPVWDAPVGENLMDHVGFFGLTWSVDKPVAITSRVLNPAQPYWKEYLMKQSGVFTIPGSCEVISFIDTKHPGNHSGLPDIELLFSTASFRSFSMIPLVTGLNERICQMWSKYIGHYGWNIHPILMKPKSRGRIRLLANDVNVYPEIELNYFDDPEDVRTMIAGIRAAIRIGQTKAMQEFGSRLLNDIPGCEKDVYDSYDYWECAIRILSSTYYHMSGTCKMGPGGDPTAVVDSKLKVLYSSIDIRM
ncbi:Glucose dehydrogenase [acceptor] [Ooceraea biroi]|uniref:Glucose dehydrogenase [acceptor] n=1 Tax=Ooceraea biroi TaxID=2015173 RepID=A0A026WDL7_OOCBI|nr:Glucose dehydrogenase [acceptor] [Ooceraea biroi]